MNVLSDALSHPQSIPTACPPSSSPVVSHSELDADERSTKATILAHREKPASREIDAASIPDTLKAETRWLGWRWRWNDKSQKWDKPPVNARTGGAGSSTNSATWCSFDEAIAAVRAERCDGIGFVLGQSETATFAGADLDDCRDPDTGKLSELATQVIAELDTYCEVSPTGTGIKLLFIGSLPANAKTKNRAGTIELYSAGRYFTITSQHIESTPTTVRERQEQLMAIWQRYIGDELPIRKPRRSAAKSPESNVANDGALADMLGILPEPTENDGSRRLFTVACRAVEHDLSDEEALLTIRAYEETYPFPVARSDEDILQRIRQAEKRDDVQRGSVVRRQTDMGNAERFRDQNAEDVRFCHAWQKWIIWDGRRWEIDDSGEAIRRAKHTVRSIYVEASQCQSDEMRKQLVRWATVSEQNKNINAMLALAKSELPIAVDQLDSQPWLLNCQNGTVDLRTGELREHRREDYLTKCVPVEWSNAKPDLWLGFLKRIFDGNQNLINFMQRLMGLSLVGEVQEHILPIFFGSGANGKSVLISTWLGLLGEYGAKAPASLLMASKSKQHPTELASLFGKRLVAASETDDGCRLSEALVKDLTGGEPIKARRMREDFWEFTPNHTLVLSTNHKPIIRGTDNGIWRRIVLVPFSVTIPADQQDRELPSKLRSEWSAILKWAVDGCLDWQKNGLQPPDEVTAATNGYRSDMDVLGQFIEQCCVVAPKTEVAAGDVYATYKTWAMDRGEYVQTQTAFGTRLSERGFTNSRTTKGEFRGRTIWHGLALAV